jgi:hypothetical protein
MVICTSHDPIMGNSVSVLSLHVGYLQTRATYMARLGEQAAAAWKSVNRNPLLASLSRFGVLISPPKQAKSLKPRSSATMTRKLGRLDLLVVSMLLSSLPSRVVYFSFKLSASGSTVGVKWK